MGFVARNLSRTLAVEVMELNGMLSTYVVSPELSVDGLVKKDKQLVGVQCLARAGRMALADGAVHSWS